MENRKEKEKENPAQLPSSPLGPPAVLASTPSPCSASARASPTPTAWPTCSGRQPRPASTSRGRTHSARTILCDPTCRVAQRDAPRAPLPESTYQRQCAHTRSLSSARTPVAPSHRRMDPTHQWLHLPFPFSSPHNGTPDITGEFAGIHIPLHPAIPGARPLIGPSGPPCTLTSMPLPPQTLAAVFA